MGLPPAAGGRFRGDAVEGDVGRSRTFRAAAVGAVVLVALAAVPVSMRAAQAASWRVAEADRPYVERALRGAMATFAVTPEEYRRRHSPTVERRNGQTCVRLTSVLNDQGGNYSACYDAGDQVVEERATACHFGGRSVGDRLHEVLLGI